MYMKVYTCVCVRLRKCVCLSARVCVYVCVCVSAREHARACVCVCKFDKVCMGNTSFCSDRGVLTLVHLPLLCAARD